MIASHGKRRVKRVMGSHKHEAVVVTASPGAIDAIIAFHEEMPDDFYSLLVGPVQLSNAVASFVLMPDGSNEGYKTSIEMDKVRAAFINLLQTLDNAEWVHVVLYDEPALDKGESPGPYIVTGSYWEMWDPKRGFWRHKDGKS